LPLLIEPEKCERGFETRGGRLQSCYRVGAEMSRDEPSRTESGPSSAIEQHKPAKAERRSEPSGVEPSASWAERCQSQKMDLVSLSSFWTLCQKSPRGPCAEQKALTQGWHKVNHYCKRPY